MWSIPASLILLAHTIEFLYGHDHVAVKGPGLFESPKNAFGGLIVNPEGAARLLDLDPAMDHHLDQTEALLVWYYIEV